MSYQRNSFRPSDRIRHSQDFLRLKNHGHRTVIGSLVINWKENSLQRARLGMVVSRKVGNAVVRNKVRRWLRETFRLNRTSLGATDIILVARRSASKAGFERIQRDFLKVLKHEAFQG